MLRVGVVGMLGDGMAVHVAREDRLGARIAFRETASRAAHEKIDARARNHVGQGRAFNDVDGGCDETHGAGLLVSIPTLRGGAGKKTLTRA